MIGLFALLQSFVGDARTLLIALLIVLDLGTGVMAALRTHRFDWKALGAFYGTNVVPFVLGYALVYIVAAEAGALLTDPLFAALLTEIGQTGGFAVIVATLAASIRRNLAEVGQGPAGGVPGAP